MSLIFEDYLETGDDPKNIAKDLKIDKLACPSHRRRL